MSSAGQGDPSVLDGSIPAPFAVLRESALTNNLEQMRRFCVRNDVELAPHCKTHLSPELWRMQAEHGAVMATLATAEQAEAFFERGVRRILIANEVVDAGGLHVLSELRRRDREFEISVLVDSVAAVQRMAAVLDEVATGLPALPVLVEFGISGRRTGCRTLDEVLAVAEAVRASGSLVLVGLEGYEGVVNAASAAERDEKVDAYLDEAVHAIRALIDRGLVTRPTIATFGGSRFYPAVIERVRGQLSPDEARVILRSGCYLTHDHGTYAASHAEIPSTVGKPDLQPALEVWGAVLSTPEPGLALVGLGKRDVSYDEGMPVPLLLRRDGETIAVRGLSVTQLNDQHAFLRLDGADATQLRVGDLMAFGISHPCTAFDKWRSIPIVDDDYRVLETAHTLFH